MDKSDSKNGNLVWSGVTDENGRTNFDIEFNDNNHSDTWKLEIEYNNKKFMRYITLLTSTPIQIYFTTLIHPGDCNGDGRVTIAEVQKVINAFLGF